MGGFGLWLRWFLFFVLGAFSFGTTSAQISTIQGQVFDQDSIALPGVSVLPSLGEPTATDVNGRYTIRFEVEKPDSVLCKYSFIGFATKEIWQASFGQRQKHHQCSRCATAGAGSEYCRPRAADKVWKWIQFWSG